MLQRLPIALAQVKASNTSKNLLNERRQIIYSLYRAKEITKKLYNIIVNSVKVEYQMNTVFMNSKNSKTFDPHRLKDKYIALSNLSVYYTWKDMKNA